MSASAEARPALRSLRQAVPLDPEIDRVIQTGLETRVYGPYLEAMIEHGVAGVRSGTFDQRSMELAIGTAAMLYSYADAGYANQEGTLSDEELATHQANILAGTIKFVPAHAATSEAESVLQVKTADDFLADQPDDVQAIIAELNYAVSFRPQTMASATRTLDRREIGELLALLDTNQEAMPHLTVSNWAIGQTVAGIYRFASESEQPLKVRIFDIGSGHGATLAAIISSIHSLGNIEKRPELAITGLETTEEFYQELTAFTQGDQGATQLGLQAVSHSANGSISEFGTLTTVKADAVNALQNIDPKSLGGYDELTIATGNYSWHRLGRGKKAEIMKLLRQVPNIIFLIGDLANNTSAINKQFFNLGVNGPLNTGNLYLREQFQAWGYWVENLDKKRPASIDSRLAKRISHDGKYGDGHLWIAHSGGLTFDALDLIDVA